MSRLPPDAHILPLVLPDGTPAFDVFYDRKVVWPADSLARRQAVLEG
jgi:hypothetical protein